MPSQQSHFGTSGSFVPTTNNTSNYPHSNVGASNGASSQPQFPNFSSYSSQYQPNFSTSSFSHSHFPSSTTTKQAPQGYSNYNPQSATQPFQLPQFSPSHFANTPLPDLQQLGTPQLYQLFAQFQQIIKHQSEELSDDKKRRPVRPVVRKVRQTRPKVVEAKGAVQCKGKNRKKGMQCRNAALMEYIGPRPIYCAEHIELDPKSLYEKCKSLYQKEVNDNKGCKEVVLKEFGVCYKHYTDMVVEMIHKRDNEMIRKHHLRITELLIQLEKEASAAKKKDGDLYQRKNKLIPKFQEMKKIINKAVETIDGSRTKEDADVAPTNPDEFIGHSVFGVSDVVDAFTDVSD